MKLNESLTPQLKGRVTILAGSDMDQLDVLFEEKNLVVDASQTVLAGLLQRDFVNYAVQFIGVGDGGDFDQAAKVDTGARVAPAVTDTELRSVIARIPILQVDVNESDPLEWTYTAVAKKGEAVTTGFDELSLETTNGTLVSHFITPADTLGGRARKYPKTTLEYLVFKWTIKLV